MTVDESYDRAERIIALFMKPTEVPYAFLVTEVARELRRVAEEAGWKTEVKNERSNPN